jgi:hypothetical protein
MRPSLGSPGAGPARADESAALEVRLELADLQELFVAPAPDAFAGRPHGESGMDRIL